MFCPYCGNPADVLIRVPPFEDRACRQCAMVLIEDHLFLISNLVPVIRPTFPDNPDRLFRK